MQATPAVKAILDDFGGDNPGTKANLARILMQGALRGTGRMVVLPVDQGFEHGPARVKHVVQACFNGRRIVVSNGGEAKDSVDATCEEAQGLADGGTNGSITCRNTFKPPHDEAIALLTRIIAIHQNAAGHA